MAEPRFFPEPEPLPIAEIIALTSAEPGAGTDISGQIKGAAALDRAGPSDIAFIDGAAYLADLRGSKAGACFCPPEMAGEVPRTTVALIVKAPARAFAIVCARLFPAAMRGPAVWPGEGISERALVHPEARLEDAVCVEPFATIAAGAAIGRGSRIGAGAAIGPGVQIGRDCAIGAGATITHALIGDRVLIHAGVRIGQDGFGYIGGRDGHLKVPQLGRVVVQDGVEIGANTTIDRGSVRDTVVGEGSKIDNLCQVAHNVTIGRHCVIAGQVGISGSVTIGDFVAIGGNSGIAGHLTIGSGASLGGMSGLMHNVPAGGKWIGSPARPVKEWVRSQADRARRADREGVAGQSREKR